MKERVGRVGRDQLHLTETDSLDALDDDTPLELLVVKEEATTGMYGPFSKGPKSKLFLATLTSGFTPKEEGAGGSYGYGKAGLVLGSTIKSVVAYTCFGERDDEPDVTRRLLGVTYWPPHELAEESHPGFGRLGVEAKEAGHLIPLENERADEYAAALGLGVRDQTRMHDWGTTFLLVEPTIAAEDLCRAIERNWWPAILEELFTIEIIDAEGRSFVPRPRQNPDLTAFIRAYDFLGTGNTEGSDGPLRFKRFTFNRLNLNGYEYDLGDLVLVADPAGWTFPANGETSESGEEEEQSVAVVTHRSLVALIRGPRMVVEYSDRGQAAPFVRGVFIAADAIDDFLRQTEPKGHDRWQSEPSRARASHPHATRVARSLSQRIDRMVRDFRKLIAPPPVAPEGAKLDVFDDLMARLLRGRSRNPPPPRPRRLIAIQFPRERVVPAEDGNCRLDAAVRLALSENATALSEEVEILVDYAFASDAGRSRDDRPELTLDLPAAFEATRRSDGVYVLRGTLTHAPTTVQIESESYPLDWSGELRVVAKRIAETVAVTGNGD